MKILSIDYGEKRLGLAVGDTETGFAFGRETLTNKGNDFIVAKLRVLIQAEEIEKIIIGLPKSLSGKDSIQTKKVREFGKYVKMGLKLPIEFIDERLTSVQAKKSGVKDLDRESARLILETYFEQHKDN